MGQGTGIRPSEKNIYDFVIDSGAQWDTSNAVFKFFTKDAETCEKTPFDITNVEIEVEVYGAGNKLVYTASGIEIIKNGNEAHIVTTALDLKRGVYSYKVFFVGSYSVIKATLKID